MDKKRFLEILGKNEDFDLIKLYEKMQLAKNKGITIFTSEFYTPDIWNKLENLNLEHMTIESYGVFNECDRRIIAFNRSYEEFPIKVLKIKCNTKFAKLEHKDYLGAVMSLGIKRSKVGDLIIFDDTAYLVVHDNILDYIILNLVKIKNLTCRCELVDIINENIQFQYEEKTVISTSTRVDCIVAALCNISRNKANTLLSQGKVLVNYEQINEKSKYVNSDNKIIIRGFGKFIIKNITGTTKSGRLKLTVLKYA